jgi:outer membrane protein TolC
VSLKASGVAAADTERDEPGLSRQECVKVALKTNASIHEAGARIKQWSARLAEVRSYYYPKLVATAFVSPMFSMDFGDITSTTRDIRWKSIDEWGPYLGVEASVIQPLYAFGRIRRGEDAARQRLLMEQAAMQITESKVALEVRKLHALYLYARSVKPSLLNGLEILGEASKRAQAMYDKATGEVSQVDLMKLRYGLSELNKLKITASSGEKMAFAALKHAMGWPESHALQLAQQGLPRRGLKAALPSLATCLSEAAANRPEWRQLKHGKQSALALADAEILANAPTLALAATTKLTWAPTVENTHNLYHRDEFNDVFGGLAFVVRFDLDPWKSSARQNHALAIHDQVEALHRFAATGIPLQVRQAHHRVDDLEKLGELSKDGVLATKRWLSFALTAFESGTGEARDVIEGVVAHLQAKNSSYESIRDHLIAQAQLNHAMGKIWVNPKDVKQTSSNP